MSKVFTSQVELVTGIEQLVKNALMVTSIILVKHLRDSINSQYYKDPSFYPNAYHRTYKFLDSASYQLIGKNMAEIFVDTDMMNYSTGIDPEEIVDWAGQSMHGSELYQTETEDFWTVFEQYCEENAIQILKQELRNQGLNIVK